MKKTNEVLTETMYDAIDLYLDLNESDIRILDRNLKDSEKVPLALYLALIKRDEFIRNVIFALNYKYGLNFKREKRFLSVSEYYDIYCDKFYKYLTLNKIDHYTSCNEVMETLLNNNVIESLNMHFNYNSDLLKDYWGKINSQSKIKTLKIK